MGFSHSSHHAISLPLRPRVSFSQRHLLSKTLTFATHGRDSTSTPTGHRAAASPIQPPRRCFSGPATAPLLLRSNHRAATSSISDPLLRLTPLERAQTAGVARHGHGRRRTSPPLKLAAAASEATTGRSAGSPLLPSPPCPVATFRTTNPGRAGDATRCPRRSSLPHRRHHSLFLIPPCALPPYSNVLQRDGEPEGGCVVSLIQKRGGYVRGRVWTIPAVEVLCCLTSPAVKRGLNNVVRSSRRS
ncbi:hypothetical protein VIGAN_07091800 [Vigna angularis var. angularis]|uniref:Uncharacterized protein n=1 Tax=Vigna angularis var. angularis TaxID=157739 RepID=A0A0S3SHC6_PHAAN|nr:hypothetical protein VIGAN_07091800 [Vigna angularis var. angularis]